MEYGSDTNGWINSFALVAYIKDPLANFLDDLRRRLVPECRPHAHVTILPPRPLSGTIALALKSIREYARDRSSFQLEATGLAVFPETNVIYIELGLGRDVLMEMHRDLNRGPLEFQEPFPYHPHITLAQELTAEAAVGALATASRLWKEYRDTRIIEVKDLTFVQNSLRGCWSDLASVALAQPVNKR